MCWIFIISAYYALIIIELLCLRKRELAWLRKKSCWLHGPGRKVSNFGLNRTEKPLFLFLKVPGMGKGGLGRPGGHLPPCYPSPVGARHRAFHPLLLSCQFSPGSAPEQRALSPPPPLSPSQQYLPSHNRRLPAAAAALAASYFSLSSQCPLLASHSVLSPVHNVV